MAYGLQVRNNAGTIMIDVNSRLSRYVGSYVVSVSYPTPRFVSVPGMANDGTWFVVCVGSQPYISITINSGSFYLLNYSWSVTGISYLVFIL